MKLSKIGQLIALVFFAQIGLEIAHAEDAPESTAPSYVTSMDETLGEIALRLYGRAAYLAKIAQWNDLHAPYRLRAGMHLTLKESPKLTAEEGDLKLLNMWRARLGVSEAEIENPKNQGNQNEPLSVEALSHEASVEEKQGDLPQATASYRKARETAPDSLFAWFSEISLLLKQGKRDEAKKTARLLVEKKPEMKDVPLVNDLLKN